MFSYSNVTSLSINWMAAGSRLPRSSQGFFLLSSTFQTHFVQLVKPSQVFVRPTGMQALPSPVNSTIIIKKIVNLYIAYCNYNKFTLCFVVCAIWSCECCAIMTSLSVNIISQSDQDTLFQNWDALIEQYLEFTV